MNCACPEVGAWRRAGYKREQFAQNCPEANFLREEVIVPRDGPLAGFVSPTLRQKSRFAPKSSAHRAAAVRSGACCIFPTERHCSVERERCLLKEIRLLISALGNALPLPRSHRRRAAAASTAGHRRPLTAHLRYVRDCNV